VNCLKTLGAASFQELQVSKVAHHHPGKMAVTQSLGPVGLTRENAAAAARLLMYNSPCLCIPRSCLL